MFRGIYVNYHPYKINGGQEVLIMNLMMLSKDLSIWKDDARVNTLPVLFIHFFKSITLSIQSFL